MLVPNSTGNAEPQRNSALPDYLPARMINEYVYCPRLFYYEQVEGVFVHSADTVEGLAQHKRVDREDESSTKPIEDTQEKTVRSLMLSSDEHRIIAKLDLAVFKDGKATPIDYKRGRPAPREDGIGVWPADRAQLAVQAIALRANGYTCDEGIVYYQKTKQRVRISFDDDTIAETERIIEDAWKTARSKKIPGPLVDSPKCLGCSLVGVCMPDETHYLVSVPSDSGVDQLELFGKGEKESSSESASRPRLLVSPRSDRRPLYLNRPKIRVGKSGGLLRVKEGDKVLQDVRIEDLCQVNLLGGVQITTQAVQALCNSNVPICYFSQGGWFYGVTSGMSTKNVFLRQSQFRLAENHGFGLRIARRLVAGKIRNQRTMLLRNHAEPPKEELKNLKTLALRATNAASQDRLLGLEGAAARIYFSLFSGMLKREPEAGKNKPYVFDFKSRNRRPPRDGVNALLSLGYSLLTKDFTIACHSVGFDPMVGFYHKPRHGKPALALDLMEPLRPLIVDSAVLSAINTRMLTGKEFVQAGDAVSLTPVGRKSFYRAYELRMNTLVTHPLLHYQVSYRRLLDIQTRLLAKTIESDIAEYPVFETR